MCILLHVKCPLFSSGFNESLFSRQIFEKFSHIKSYENPSSGSRVVPCGQTDTQTDGRMDRQTDRKIYQSLQSLFAILTKRLHAFIIIIIIIRVIKYFYIRQVITGRSEQEAFIYKNSKTSNL
jgi:hypothetical protein